jgi:hypothetical protein
MLPPKIPKIAHCFWYHPSGLPFLRYLSIASFAIQNPECDLRFYSLPGLATGRAFNSHEQSVEHISKDYTELLLSLPNVSRTEVPAELTANLSIQLSTAVHVSDVLRVYLLSTVGGYWIDSDIVFTTSLRNSFIGLKENENVDTLLSLTSLGAICPYVTHRIGLLASSVENVLFRSIMESLKTKTSTSEYQAFGSVLYNELYPTTRSIYKKHRSLSVLILPNHAVYSLHLTELLSNRIRIENFVNNSLIVGCHWYGGGDQLTEFVSLLNNAEDVESEIRRMKEEAPCFLVELFCHSLQLLRVLGV